MKKVLSLVLVLTLVLGSFSFAFAATPTDVVGTEYEDAVERLGQLGVLTGYDDGTFKPENTITRAEFAAVVVRAKGLEAAAQASKGATAFSDVAAGSWAAGYVNVASKMGFVKGMGDGTFAPNAPVTYEQAVTMVMRALGYEPAAEAKGGYPYGYLIVANEIGLLDKVNGTTGAPAPRGLVAKVVDNALEIPLMVQVSYGDKVEYVVSGTREGVAEKTLLSELGYTKFTGRVIEANASKKYVKIEDSKGNTKTLNADEDFDFQNAYGLTLRVWYDVNGNLKLYTALDTPLFDAVKSNKDGDIYLYGEDDYYELATDKDGKVIATIYLNGEKIKASEIDKFDADYAKIVLDSYGDIIWAQGFTFDGNIAVEKVDGNVVESYGYEEISLKGYTIVNKDGKTISLSDLEQNDLVFYNKDNKFAVVANNTVSGVVEKVYTDRFVVAGETYYIESYSRYLDDTYMNDLTDSVLDSMRKEGKEATVYFDFYGDVVLVVGTRAASTSSSDYFLLAAPSRQWKDSRNNTDYYTLDVLNAEGKIVKYDVKKSEVNDAHDTVVFTVNGAEADWLTNLSTVNTILKLTVNSSNKVTKVEVLENHAISSALKVTASYVDGYKLQDSTIVFRADGEAVEDYDILTWAKANEVFTKITAGRYYVGSNGRVVAIFADTTDAKAANTFYYGRIKDVATKRDGIKEVTILAGGKEYTFDTETKSIDGINKLVKYAMVKLTVVDKTEKIKKVEDLAYVTAKVTELQPGNKVIVTDLGTFELVEDAVIYKDATNTTLRFADLKVGDYLNVYKREGSSRFVLYAVKVAEPTTPPTAGTITYKNATTKKIEVDGVVYTLDASSVLRNAEGTIIADGDAEILGKLTEDVSVVYDIVAKDGVISSFKLQTAAADTLSVANITGHVAGTAVSVEIKAIDSVSEAVDTSYAKTVSVTLSGALSLTQDVTFVKGVGTLTIPADSAPSTVGTSGTINVDGDSLTQGSFTITTVAGKAAAMTLSHPGAVQYVKATLAITGLQDAAGNNIAGDYVVKVVSDKDGEVFNASKAVTGGAVNVDVTLTTVATHTLTVTVDGFSKTTTAVITADETAPAWTSIQVTPLNSGKITINTTGAVANQIYEAESGVKSVVINIAGTDYVGTVKADGSEVTFTGLPTVTAGVNYTITITDNAGNVTTVAGVVLAD